MSGGLSGLILLTSCTSNDGTANYSYDPTGQLIGATSTPGGPGERVLYLGRQRQPGQLRRRGRADNELLSDGTYTYSYDAEGNRTAKFIDANEDGCSTRAIPTSPIHLGRPRAAGRRDELRDLRGRAGGHADAGRRLPL